ncbi:uncharacterized protein N7529_010794 [Penicillium soppii]|uniref:uncharacterized protein n=1 Tax=Penicillium soppii TaxID=69789 RepID=UPI00254850E8|nr:uncharacterized protein N7529_010794 [Penicillium soppii]KAJ5851409.1 hypothetical protein N7529_010794 [Penicillium soppii]
MGPLLTALYYEVTKATSFIRISAYPGFDAEARTKIERRSVAVATIAAPTFQPLPARDINLDAAGPGDGNKPGLYDSKAL